MKYATTNGTAVSGTNYTTGTGTLSFAAGVTNKTFTIKILNDHVASATNKVFTVGLSAPTGSGTLGTTIVGTVVLVDAGPDAIDAAGHIHNLDIRMSDEGDAILTITGDVRAKLSIQGSNDLVKWTNITDVELPAGYAQWADKTPEADRYHYYRIWDASAN